MKKPLTLKMLRAAKALVKKYRALTIEKVNELVDSLNDGESLFRVVQKYSGFGDPMACTLCRTVAEDCIKCIHGETVSGEYGCLNHSYDRISYANTPERLLSAVHKRANYIESLILEESKYRKEYIKDNPKPHNVSKNNLIATRKLIKKYRKLEVGMVPDSSSIDGTYFDFMSDYSGLGAITCTLCDAARRTTQSPYCSACIHYTKKQEQGACGDDLYVKMIITTDKQDLVRYVHQRADYLEGLLEDIYEI